MVLSTNNPLLTNVKYQHKQYKPPSEPHAFTRLNRNQRFDFESAIHSWIFEFDIIARAISRTSPASKI